ncbi:cytochrome c oxidase assembly protein [Paenibacillus aestuarii]|uniref:Cytochrome c oxidase assembly protein n=1 Tax=Paenibacillus aestuarii TaxID=516965 RepID=A0ABW0K175_9BACL|nr:cytochrome c oxidase assembly protein [Paenibacillus aestuarii]
MNQIGGFFELWNPVLLLVVIVVGYVYSRLVAKGNGNSTDESVSGTQQLSFYFGLALFYIGQGSPINFLGHHYLFSMHMLQQTLLYLTVPIFIWIGLPAWMVRALLLKNSIIRGLFSFLTRPLIALFLFNMLFSIYHMPFIMDGLMRHEWLQLGYHTVLLISAFVMWFPVFCPIPEMNRLSELKKLAYIFGNGVLLTPACALIIFADTVIYDMYTNVTIPFAHLSTLDDQQLGGVIMKVLQEVIYGGTLAYIFFRWYRRERNEEEDLDAIHTHDNMNPQGGNWNRA